MIWQASATHTSADQTPSPAPRFRANDNLALDEASLFYAGKLVGGAGAFIEFNYDGIERHVAIGDLDVRRAHDFDLGRHDLVAGIDLNNSPGVEDLWNTTPVWRFPYNGSALAPSPAAAPLMEGGLEGKLLGAGAYGMLDDTLYAYGGLYNQPSRNVLSWLGSSSEPGDDEVAGATPYWRLALQHNFNDQHYLMVGAYGLHARIRPGGLVATAATDRYDDVAVDATYQFTASKTHYVSAHATWVTEHATLDASHALTGAAQRLKLSTARADLSYSYRDTLTPTVQAFRTWGDPDPVRYANGSPNSSGWVAELAFTPFGREATDKPTGNLRFSVQYVAYREFDGLRRNASANNTLYFNVWAALAPF